MPSFPNLPSVDRLLRGEVARRLIEDFGRSAVTDKIREVLAESRASMNGQSGVDIEEDSIMKRVTGRLRVRSRPSLRPVMNLTGTVLHTNLGRAALPEEAVDAMATVARGAANLEYDLEPGRRGDRDDHVEQQILQLTGAEAATVVNNNAAAVMLVLNSLASRKEVLVSRGELVEIGGSFRIPEIMASSGCRLREVGTTNRTHLSDYEAALGPKTGLVMKVHASNYSIEGFTAAVPETELSALCRKHGVPFAVDLGSGSLIDLRQFGLPHEPTAAETLAHGADLVTFSGDKLLGGPQAGVIAGRADLIRRIKRNQMKRALRVNKMTIAALSAVLRLYENPERLAERLPTLRLLTRDAEEIRALAVKIRDALSVALKGTADVDVIACESQTGSGALPTKTIPSVGFAIRPRTGKRGAGAALERLAAAFRRLPVPVIGRLQDGALILDLRCLEDVDTFVGQLVHLTNAHLTNAHLTNSRD